MHDKKVVCLGGGIGTVNLLKGLKEVIQHISVVVSMADEGGSSGRLRRLYDIQPPGDLISCIASLSNNPNELYSKLLTYRFPGDRYGQDHELAGHKVGNLLMVAAKQVTGSFEGGISLLKELFSVDANIYPATEEPVTISAVTTDGVTVTGEENIDLGTYTGKKVIDRVSLHPSSPKIPSQIISSLEAADVIIAGPGDLYTTILPVLLIPEIAAFLKHTDKKKIFVVNVTNKPYETKGYEAADFIHAIKKHLDGFPFDTVVVNNNYSMPIPTEFKYTYVKVGDALVQSLGESLIMGDLVKDDFPIYHDSHKLAKIIGENI